jgi:hypothetical protein
MGSVGSRYSSGEWLEGRGGVREILGHIMPMMALGHLSLPLILLSL